MFQVRQPYPNARRVRGAEPPRALRDQNANSTENKDFNQIWFASLLIFSMTSKNKFTKILPSTLPPHSVSLEVRPDQTNTVLGGETWKANTKSHLHSWKAGLLAAGSGRHHLFEPRR